MSVKVSIPVDIGDLKKQFGEIVKRYKNDPKYRAPKSAQEKEAEAALFAQRARGLAERQVSPGAWSSLYNDSIDELVKEILK